MGLPKQLIQAARRHFDQRSGAFRQAIRATSASRRKSEAARSEAEAARLAAEGARSTYAGKLAELESLQGQFEAWLASLAELKAGDPVPVPGRDRPGRLVRLQFNKQIAVVDFDNVQVEVPLADLMPDLGQSEARDQITSLRAQVLSQARQGEQLRQEAQRTHAEYQRALAQQRARQQQYERWLAEIASARVGQEVPIARPPGRGTLVELDFPRGQAKVQAGETAIELPVQDLFPQSGPFVHRQRGPEPRTEKPSRRDERPRPIPRRRPESAAAKANRQAVLATAPGQQVYVIPFRKRATLIRFNEDQDHALVQSGAFEVEVPVADLEPARERE